MDNIQLCYIDNEINKIDKMKQGDVIYKNGMELLVVLSYDHNEPCKGCFFYKNKACGSEKLIKCWDCKKEYIFTAIRKYNTTELCGIVKRIHGFEFTSQTRDKIRRLTTSPDGRDVVVPGKWHGKFPKKKATEEQLKHVGYKNLIR